MNEPELKDRITAWIGSANCWCDNSDKVYCTPCEIMIDALDRIEYLESLLDKKIEAVPVAEGAVPVFPVGH